MQVSTIVIWAIVLLFIAVAVFFLVKYWNFIREKFTDAPNKPTVTLYWMENCPHCVQFKDEWSKYKIMAAEKGEVNTRDYEATRDKSVVQAAGVTGFPTIRYSDGKGSVDYDGSRTAIELNNWVVAQMRKSATAPSVSA